MSTSYSLKADQTLLKQALSTAKSGDFVVLKHSKTLSLFHIFQVDDTTLTLEEISAPDKLLKIYKGKWQSWLDQGAPGHLSWIMYQLDLTKREIQDVYSCSEKSWKKVFPNEQILPSLMELSFRPIAKERRKRVGPPLPSEMIDDRPLWQPPVFFSGQKVPDSMASPYIGKWPKDGTYLSGKKVEIFLADEPDFVPKYFPIWIQVLDKGVSVKIRVVDSGTQLQSPYTHFPLPPIELKAHQFTLSGDLVFSIHAHRSLKELKVYASGSNSPYNIELPFEFELPCDSTEKNILIKKEALQEHLKPQESYTFIFEPQEAAQLSAHTLKPITALPSHVSH